MNDSGMVMIPIKRYEELLRTETRVNLLVERYTYDKYIKDEDVLFTLGTELAAELALEIIEKRKITLEEYDKTNEVVK
jgi:hypothetical protein